MPQDVGVAIEVLDMNELKNNSRRDLLKRVTYVAPVVLAFSAAPHLREGARRSAATTVWEMDLAACLQTLRRTARHFWITTI